MIRGIAQGDVAVLVVPANKGGFEYSILRGNHRKGIPKGESRVQAEMCHAMGVEQMIVCINKMDDRSVKWSEERFKEIKEEIGKILTKIGYISCCSCYVQSIGIISLSITQLQNEEDSIYSDQRMAW